MKLDERKLYQIMSEFHMLGDEDYGGQGTFQEAVLVGYIYGILSESQYSVLKPASVKILTKSVIRFPTTGQERNPGVGSVLLSPIKIFCDPERGM